MERMAKVRLIHMHMWKLRHERLLEDITRRFRLDLVLGAILRQTMEVSVPFSLVQQPINTYSLRACLFDIVTGARKRNKSLNALHVW